MWDANLMQGDKPGVVMGHVHYVQGACDWHANSVKVRSQIFTLMIDTNLFLSLWDIQAIPLMAAWHYNWTAVHAVHGERVYFSTQTFDGIPQHLVPKVLALGPKAQVQLAETLPDIRAFQLKLHQLAKLALMTGRVPVWPTVDCTSMMVASRHNHTQHNWPKAPFENPEGWLQYFNRQLKMVRLRNIAWKMPFMLLILDKLLSYFPGHHSADHLIPIPPELGLLLPHGPHGAGMPV